MIIWLRRSEKHLHGWRRENRTEIWWFWKEKYCLSKDINLLWLSSLPHSLNLPVNKNKISHRHTLFYWASQMLHVLQIEGKTIHHQKRLTCFAEATCTYVILTDSRIHCVFMNLMLSTGKDPIRSLRQSPWLTSVKYLIQYLTPIETKIKLRVLKMLLKFIDEGRQRASPMYLLLL